MSSLFEYNIIENGIEFFLNRNGQRCSLNEWHGLDNLYQIEIISIIENKILEENEDVNKLENNSGYFLSFNFVSLLSDQQSKAINLPQNFPFRMKINTKGNIAQKEFNIWISTLKGIHPWPAKRLGCFVEGNGNRYKLSSDLFKVWESVDQFRNSKEAFSLDRNMNFISSLKTLLPNQASTDLSFEGQIKSITLQHASAFSINIKGNYNSPEINPVLFNKKIKDRVSENEEIIEEDEQILSEGEANAFLAYFKKNDDVKKTYLLGAGNYIYIDPTLREALSVVHDISKSNQVEKKREFLRNPQIFIKEVLNKENSENNIDAEDTRNEIDKLFIETRQFSERVTGLGIWKPPELPWLATEANEWSSDSYHFEIQNKVVSFPKEDLKIVIDTIQKNVDDSNSISEINGIKIDTDKDFLNQLKDLLPYSGIDLPPGEDKVKEKKDGPFVLLTEENFEEMKFQLTLKTRDKLIKSFQSNFINPEISLKKHQEEGLKWLIDSYNKRMPGVLMADDMGLGKTLQSLAFLSILKQDKIISEKKPILIVAPVSLLQNWEDEHNKHLTNRGLGLLCRLYGNSLKEFKTSKGNDIINGKSTLNIEELFTFDWLLTTYETLRDYSTSLAEINFSCVVFDEIQKAKNPRSLLTKTTKIINTDFAIGLTGTPVENSLADLWQILDILSPARLPYTLKSFMEEYPEDNLEKLRELSKLLLEPSSNRPAFVLRRMKDEVIKDDLPEKTLANSSETTMLMEDLQNDAYSNAHNNLKSDQISKIQAIHQFRTISLHPMPEQADKLSIDDFINSSARMKITFAELDKIKQKNEKVLIFLERRLMQPVLAGVLREKYKMNHTPLIINGLVKGSARQDYVNNFQTSPLGFDVMILSPKAGGVGLTLTAANHVIHLERWWNPAVEDQCTDRAYRIGQTKPVRVITPLSKHRMLDKNSFDIVLDNILKNKRNISKGVFIPTSINPLDFTSSLMGETSTSISLEDIDTMEPLNFEKYIKSQLDIFTNLQVYLTQASYDHGADLIIKNNSNNKSAIIQCKHRSQSDKSVSQESCEEVLNTKNNYRELNSPLLYVVSNSSKPTQGCKSVANQNNIKLIFRDKLLNLGNIISTELS